MFSTAIVVEKPVTAPTPKIKRHLNSSSEKTISSHDIFLSFIAGAVTGATEVCIAYPTEYVKTHLQLQQLSAAPAYKGICDCVLSTVQEHGPLGLYRGITPVLLGSMPKQASRWAAYEWSTEVATEATRRWRGLDASERHVKLSMPLMSVCGLFAGAVEAVCAVAPTETVKTRLIHDARQPMPRYHRMGVLRAVRLMVHENGVRHALFSGVGATVVKQGLNQSLRFPLQSAFVEAISAGGHDARRKGPGWNGLAGFFAGVISVILTQPVDVIKTQLQSSVAPHQRMGWVVCGREIYRQRGVAGFYSGCIARSVNVGAHVALTFTVFPMVRHAILASGGGK